MPFLLLTPGEIRGQLQLSTPFCIYKQTLQTVSIALGDPPELDESQFSALSIILFSAKRSLMSGEKTQQLGALVALVKDLHLSPSTQLVARNHLYFVSFKSAGTRKQPRCPSTEEWIKKTWHIYTMEYYSGVKSNDTMKFAGKSMELENIIPSKLDSRSLTWLLAVDLCICFHQLLDESSMKTVRIFTNLITR
ncbi:hypothetical protein STEG23_033740, partial [Scotinomys teguina]